MPILTMPYGKSYIGPIFDNPDEALHKYIEEEKESIDEVLRRVIREELHQENASPN